MLNLQGWDWVFLAGAVLVSVRVLVTLMLARRDKILHEMLTQAEAEQQRKAMEEKKNQKAAKKAKAA